MKISKKIAEKAVNKRMEDFLSPEDNKYMHSKPTRIEVANYINALMDNHYMPLINNNIQMSMMVLQAIMLKKGICTGDEIKEITEQFVEENHRRMKTSQALKDLHDPKNADKYAKMENGLVQRLDNFISDFMGDKWKEEELTEDEKKSILSVLNTVFLDLVCISTYPEDKSTIKFIEDELSRLIEELNNLKSAIDEGTIVVKDAANKISLKALIDDSLERLNKGAVV